MPHVQHYESALKDFADLGDSLPVLGPDGYGSFETKAGLVRRKSIEGLGLDKLSASVVARELSRRTVEAVFVLDVAYTPEAEDSVTEDSDALAVSIACSQVADTLRSLVFAANIAKPASIPSATISVSADSSSHVFEAGQLINDFEGLREYASRTGWPTLADMPLVEAWTWIAKNLLHGRTGDSPISRAFNSYTYLFASDIPTPLKLAVALMGIEALFTDGRPGIASQVVERAQLVLGNRDSFKADLRRMYEARSAVIHGSSGFPPFGFPFDAPDGYRRRRTKMEEATDIAGAVMIATFQRCVQNSWNVLEFREVVNPRADDYDQANSDELGLYFARYRKADLDAYLDSHLVGENWPSAPEGA